MLSEDAKNLIRNLFREYGSYREVARLAKVSDKTVRSIVLDLYVKDKRRPGPKPEIKPRETRAMARSVGKILAEGSRVTARKVQAECALERVSTRTVQRKLKSMDMTYQPAKMRIVLTAQHKKSRLEKARAWLGESMDWRRVVWSDEKRFNSDGPDSWQSWQPQSRPVTRNRRQQGGPSLQVWGALIPGPILVVFELPERGDSKDFMEFIEFQVLPTLKELAGDDFILQQDRAPTHTSAYSKQRFRELAVELLDWPSRSPDLNIIENCWSLLSQRVYDGKQFGSKAELWDAIDSAVTDINVNCRGQLEALFESIPKRMLEVIDRKGALTHY